MANVGKYRVFYVSRYSVTDSKTGEINKGCKVCYAENYPMEDPNFRGVPIITTPGVDYSIFDKFQKLPATYELDFVKLPGSAGTKEKIVNAKYLEG